MQITDLSTLAAQLRQEGLEARNLAQVGITVWHEGKGRFLGADELRQFVSPSALAEALRKNGHHSPHSE